MATTVEHTVTVKFAWWVAPYIHLCCVFALAFGFEVDREKVAQFIVNHGVRIT